jgi:hypothetical protein
MQYNKIKTKKRTKNDIEMKFDLWQIIIWNDSRIIIVMITKIPSYINQFSWNIITKIIQCEQWQFMRHGINHEFNHANLSDCYTSNSSLICECIWKCCGKC